MKAALFVVLLLILAAALLVAGIFLLAGEAWAMIAGAMTLLCFAALLSRGLTTHG